VPHDPQRIAPLLLLATVACEAEAKKPETKSAPPPARVETASVETGAIQDRWRFLGDVRSSARASLASGASGAVTKVRAREGDVVKKGHLLVEVDPALAAARVGVASASVQAGQEALEQAERELQRLESLKANVVAAIELERAKSKVRELSSRQKGLEAQHAEARAQLNLHRVYAPFDGVVARRVADVGDWVRPGDAVMELVSTADVEILVDAARELYGRVSAGDAVRILAKPPVDGEVLGVVPALSPQSRTLRVRVGAKGSTSLLPGGAVEVEFPVSLQGDGVVVPEDALLPSPTNTRIVRVVDGKASPMIVDVIAKAEGKALVRGEGLAAGDVVVVRGNERLRPGQAVQP
jgi:membrane fusion protein (multidrug efflux system)